MVTLMNLAMLFLFFTIGIAALSTAARNFFKALTAMEMYKNEKGLSRIFNRCNNSRGVSGSSSSARSDN